MTILYSPSQRGFYDDAMHAAMPDDAVPITSERHADLLAGQGQGQVIVPGPDGQPVLAEPPPAPAPASPQIAKTAIYRRATDAEIGAFEAWLTGTATPRQRLMWQDAESGLVLVTDIMPIAAGLFGPERAAVLLAPG